MRSANASRCSCKATPYRVRLAGGPAAERGPAQGVAQRRGSGRWCARVATLRKAPRGLRVPGEGRSQGDLGGLRLNRPTWEQQRTERRLNDRRGP